jgi:hypothetical protein
VPFRLIIAQPWFAARGHPAQSLLNTARILGPSPDILYVVVTGWGDDHLQPIIQELAAFGTVRTLTASSSTAMSTARCLLEAVRVARGQRTTRIFFMDAHVLALAACDLVLRRLGARRAPLSVLALFAPEQLAGKWWQQALLRRWLSAPGVRLFLRTEELASAWRQVLTDVPREGIDTLPSLEIPEGEGRRSDPAGTSGGRRFGVIGQVRTGKGLEWLVPLFESNPDVGELRIEGAFFNEAQRQCLPMVASYSGFREGYIPDGELVERVAGLDYVLALYDQWDDRLEAATFYLAARAGRPVICYDAGWCGRMIREFGSGVGVRPGLRPGAEFFRALPAAGAPAYDALMAGVERFRLAHSGAARRATFLSKLLTAPVPP